MTNRLRDLPPAKEIDFDALPRRRRPKIVTFIGWVCAGAGYAGFIFKGSQLPSYLFPEWVKAHINTEWNPPHYTREQFTVSVLMLFVEMALGLIAVAGGLGSLRMREWGRRVLLVYAGLSLLETLLKAAWQIHNFDFMLDYQISTTTQPIDRELAGNKEFFALITYTAAQLLWPIIIASILTRRHIRDAFDAVRLGDGSSEGWQSTEVKPLD